MEELIKYYEKAIREGLMIDFNFLAKKYNVTYEQSKKAYIIACEVLNHGLN